MRLFRLYIKIAVHAYALFVEQNSLSPHIMSPLNRTPNTLSTTEIENIFVFQNNTYLI
jgi:hypothetical protein